ncbi:hypothetical protein [Bacillus testis]|uniref:hypothetical protein n=1 Tax=Bacillus testis TaxID=1622072 RepID=UPI00067EF43E|nr:hypothetical protein [Bacillus testis]
MGVELSLIHWLYVIFILGIIGFMVMRKDTTLICIIGLFAIAFVSTHSFAGSISGVFNSFVYAISELLPTILIISIIVSMGKVLSDTGINDVMARPFTRVMKTPALAFWTIGLVMMVTSWFFWPSPAVALLGAVLLPAALRVGLPAIGAAMAMNLFGHGIALSGDFVIQAAPKITGDAAGIPASDVISASIPLVIIMGAVTTIIAFWMLKRDMAANKLSTSSLKPIPPQPEKQLLLSTLQKRIFAILIPLLFILDIIAMFTLGLQGGEATAIVGGTAIFILLALTMFAHKSNGLEKITSYFIDGFQFGFKVFGPVIPIAAFFYLGDAGFVKMIGDVLPNGSQGIVNDLGQALADAVPLNKGIAAGTLTVVGAITGLDGSGFSGISLAGSVAHLFAHTLSSGVATLTALGQIAAIWVGGGTIIPWALIPAAAICNVDPFELARRNLIPVCIGLAITTIVAMFLL